MPTSHPRHSVTETPAVAAVLAPLRERLGASVPSFGELVIRGAEATLREIEGQDAARASRLETFVARLQTPSLPQLAEAHAVRHATRVP